MGNKWIIDFCIPLILWIVILIIIKIVEDYITPFHEGVVILLLCNVIYQLMLKDATKRIKV